MPVLPTSKKVFEHIARNRIGTVPFEVGLKYRRHDGKLVTCIKVTDLKGYECAQFDDHPKNDPESGFRYNRDEDRGRCTGTHWNQSKKHIMPAMNLVSELIWLGDGSTMHFKAGKLVSG